MEILEYEVMDGKMRFSDKVDNYVKYRPTYAQEFINYLVKDVGVSLASVVADVGAGTGILTRQLADKVKTIYAVEPNVNMRAACVDYCKNYDSVLAVNGSAEDTALPDKSVHFITAAQVFHWFDAVKTKKEFQRIVKQNGKNFTTFIESLTAVFEKYSMNGKVALFNNTHSYVGEV